MGGPFSSYTFTGSDPFTFAALTGSYLTDSCPMTNVYVARDLAATDLENQAIFQANLDNCNFPGISWKNVRESVEFDSYPFGVTLGTTIHDNSVYSDALLNDYNLGLTTAIRQNSAFTASTGTASVGNWSFNIDECIARRIGSSSSNPFVASPSMGVGNLNTNGGSAPFVASSNLGVTNGNTQAVTSNIVRTENGVIDYSKTDDKQNEYNKKVRLIKQYAKNEGNEKAYDEELAKIKASDTDALEKLDALMANFDATKLQKAVQDMVNEDKKAEKTAAKTAANAIVTQLCNTTDNMKVNLGNVNASNILLVLSQFLANPSVGEGKTTNWNDLMSDTDNFKKIKDTLVEKANSLKEKLDETKKSEIETLVSALDDTDAAKVKALYDKLKTYDDDYFKTNAQALYGVPESKNNKVAVTLPS